MSSRSSFRLLTVLCAFSFSVLCSTMSAQYVKGQKSMGIRTGYVTLNKTAMAGIEFQYAFSRHFVLAPSVDYIFRNENLDGLLINLDYHGPWKLDKSGRWNFYHILGLNYASWGSHSIDVNGFNDVNTRFNRVGLDFGAGISYFVKPTLRLSFQGKFNWIKAHNTGLFNIGISYVF